MTFRLPFQILRAVPLPRPHSPEKIIKSTRVGSPFRNFSSAVSASNNRPLPCKCCLEKKNVSLLPRFVPSYSFRFQHRFKSTNPENRRRVRKQHKCQKRKCEEKLIFRNTTREECEQCVGPIRVPDKCPQLKRLKPHYDQSKLKYNHESCPVICKPPRADAGLRIVKKKLPKLPLGDCAVCADKPTKAPKLVRLEKLYDESKLKQNRESCNPCTICAPRMDDVLGLKVKHKELPVMPAGKCEKCQNVPTYAPKLVPLKKQYDASKLLQERTCIEPKDEKPPRMDDVLGLKVEFKELPPLPRGDCDQCQNKPTFLPKLIRLRKKFDDSKLKWAHADCNPCDLCAPRMDDIVGYKVLKKSLPNLLAKCERCLPYMPKILPKLVRPGKMYDDTQMKWRHEQCDTCDVCAPRMDDVVGYKVKMKKLPALKGSQECTYCKNIPTVAPKLLRPKKSFDDSKMKWKHEDCPIVCKPSREDDVRGYKVVPKELKPIPLGDCVPCAIKPTMAPELKRPKLKYNPNELKRRDFCCNPPFECPPRMDDLMGLKVKKKKLPKLPIGNCEECIVKPKYAPELKRLEPMYNDKEMKYRHEDCNPCDICAPRMDDVVGLKVKQKRLPSLHSDDCVPCKNPPTYAPKMKRLKKKYKIVDEPRKPKPCLCDLDPPRMDDVKCWKPKKKILPAFNSSDQVRYYSTFATRRKFNHEKLLTLRQNARKLGRRYKKKKPECDPDPERCVAPKQDPACLKQCPKFKMKYCKTPETTICPDYKEKTCRKLCAPYDAYTDCMGPMYEDEMSECINWNEVLLQPNKQVSRTFCKIRPPPPKWDHIDPALERKCIAHPGPCPLPRTPKPHWCNPCTEFKLKYCKPRGRKHCNDFSKKPKCKKLDAPYLSFTDHCPQFPEKELDECEIAENMKHEYMVDYFGTNMDFKREKGNFGGFRTLCEPAPTDCEPTKKAPFPKCRQKDKDKRICAPVKFPFKRAKCGSDDDNCRNLERKSSESSPKEIGLIFSPNINIFNQQKDDGFVISQNVEDKATNIEDPFTILPKSLLPETTLTENCSKTPFKCEEKFNKKYLLASLNSQNKVIENIFLNKSVDIMKTQSLRYLSTRSPLNLEISAKSNKNGLVESKRFKNKMGINVRSGHIFKNSGKTNYLSKYSKNSSKFKLKAMKNDFSSENQTSSDHNKCKKCRNKMICVCSSQKEPNESLKEAASIKSMKIEIILKRDQNENNSSDKNELEKSCNLCKSYFKSLEKTKSCNPCKSQYQIFQEYTAKLKKQLCDPCKKHSKTSINKELECKNTTLTNKRSEKDYSEQLIKSICEETKPKKSTPPFNIKDSKVCQSLDRCRKLIKKKEPPGPPKKDHAKTAWKVINNYFRARPDCPPPRIWRQKELEEKAFKAATAAGLIVYKPEFTYVEVNPKKCNSKLMARKCKLKCKTFDRSQCDNYTDPQKKYPLCSFLGADNKKPEPGSPCSSSSRKLKTQVKKPDSKLCTKKSIKYSCNQFKKNLATAIKNSVIQKRKHNLVSCSDTKISRCKKVKISAKKCRLCAACESKTRKLFTKVCKPRPSTKTKCDNSESSSERLEPFLKLRDSVLNQNRPVHSKVFVNKHKLQKCSRKKSATRKYSDTSSNKTLKGISSLETEIYPGRKFPRKFKYIPPVCKSKNKKKKVFSLPKCTRSSSSTTKPNLGTPKKTSTTKKSCQKLTYKDILKSQNASRYYSTINPTSQNQSQPWNRYYGTMPKNRFFSTYCRPLITNKENFTKQLTMINNLQKSVIKRDCRKTFSVRPCFKTKRRFKDSFFNRPEKRIVSTYSRTNEVLNKQSEKDTNRKLNSQAISYLKLNNDYIGKIYQLKLNSKCTRKTSSSQKFEEKPYTICHACKLIPKQEFFKLSNFKTKHSKKSKWE